MTGSKAKSPSAFRPFWTGFLGLVISLVQTTAAVDLEFEPRYRALYEAAKADYQHSKTNVDLAWRFSRTAFDLAEFSEKDSERAALAREGMDAAKAALVVDETCAPARYYLAMNQGQLARTQTLGALRLVSEMEKNFKIVASLDANFDYAGADRNLGILYREAPGWPASIGSRSKARIHLEKSVKLSPEYPANQLELLQAYVDWEDTESARKVSAGIETCLSRARSVFAGEAWEWSWRDWDRFWDRLRAKLKRLPD